MALDPADLANDIKNDTSITNPIPSNAISAFDNFADRLAVHITEQIKRGEINGVIVSLSNGRQTNVDTVK